MNNVYCRTCPDRESNTTKGNCNTANPDGFPARCGPPWTIMKHWFVDGYCHIVTEAMKNTFKDKMYFIDLYAGPGLYYARPSGEIFEGSPLIASKYNFKKMFLVDLNKNNIEALKHRLAKANNEIIYYPTNANKIAKLINTEIPNDSLSFCFADPDNMKQLKFHTLKTLAMGKSMDLLINFPYGMAFKRAVKNLIKRGSVNNAVDNYLNFNDWRNIYDKYNGKFSSEMFWEVLNRYLAQFYEIGYQRPSDKYPINYEIIKNTRNQEIYFLLFLSKNALGYKLWSESVRYTKGMNQTFHF